MKAPRQNVVTIKFTFQNWNLRLRIKTRTPVWRRHSTASILNKLVFSGGRFEFFPKQNKKHLVSSNFWQAPILLATSVFIQSSKGSLIYWLGIFKSPLSFEEKLFASLWSGRNSGGQWEQLAVWGSESSREHFRPAEGPQWHKVFIKADLRLAPQQVANVQGKAFCHQEEVCHTNGVPLL